jgi:hypothetical protein
MCVGCRSQSKSKSKSETNKDRDWGEGGEVGSSLLWRRGIRQDTTNSACLTSLLPLRTRRWIRHSMADRDSELMLSSDECSPYECNHHRLMSRNGSMHLNGRSAESS